MKKKLYTKLTVLALMILFALTMTGCGSSTSSDTSDSESTASEDSSGGKTDSSDDFVITKDTSVVDGLHSIGGSLLYISVKDATYWYQTITGRVGSGEYESTDDGLAIIYNDFYYDLLYRESDQMLMPDQNGEGDYDPYNLSNLTFAPDDENDINMWEVDELDGTWKNNRGETITINSGDMSYECESDTTSGSGTVADDNNGKGVFLSLNGYAYICMGQDHNRFMLQFEAGQYSGPDGSFTGIFYRDGDIDQYTDLSKESCFTNDDDWLCYTDGVETFVLPDGYELSDDNWAVDSDGNLFGK